MSLEYPLAKAALFARLKEDKAVCKMDFEIRDDFPPTRFHMTDSQRRNRDLSELHTQIAAPWIE